MLLCKHLGVEIIFITYIFPFIKNFHEFSKTKMPKISFNKAKTDSEKVKNLSSINLFKKYYVILEIK